VHRGDDRSAPNPHAEPSCPEREDREDEERLRDPVRPIGIVLPGEAVTDGGVPKDREERYRRRELRRATGRQTILLVRTPPKWLVGCHGILAAPIPGTEILRNSPGGVLD